MRRQTGALVLAVLGSLAVPCVLRADRLDYQINERMPNVIGRLKAQKVKNVGVLRFRVKETPDGPEHFSAPICGRLVDRLETMLVIHGGPREAEALGVIHDAGGTASANRVTDWYENRAERADLFTFDYPLAWGRKKVKADAFLTGRVVLSEDRQKTTLYLEYFTRANPDRLRPLGKFEVDTDRYVLRDLGYSFRLSDRSTASLVKAREVPSDFIDKRLRADLAAASEALGGEIRTDPKDVQGIEFQMLVNGSPADIREQAADGRSEWVVDSPKKGDRIAFRLKNRTADQKLAVVLRLNGYNVINQQTDEPDTSAKIVLPPGVSETIEGFLLIDEKTEEGESKKVNFRVITDEEASRYRKNMPDKLKDLAGFIEVVVFREKEVKADPVLLIGRGLPQSKEAKARQSYLGLRDAYLKNSKLKTKQDLVTKKELIVPEDEPAHGPGRKVKIVKFPAAFAGILSVKIQPPAAAAEVAVSKTLVAADAFAASPRALTKTHILMVFDTADPKLKDTLEVDEQRMMKLWEDTIPRHMRSVTVLKGDGVTAHRILDHYRKLKVGPNESLVFFYGGHGATDPKSKEHFLDLRNGKPLLRSKLREAMLGCKAGLVVLLTDCCSSPYAIDRGRRYSGGVASRGTVVLHPTVGALLFRSRGLADITAATDNAAWSDKLDGGLFTRSVANLLKPGPASDVAQTTDWGEFSRKVRRKTETMFRNWREEVRQTRGIEIAEHKQVPLVFHKTWAAAGLANATGGTIRYRYRWTDQEEWKAARLEPGKQVAHSRPVTGKPGSAPAPALEIEVAGSQPRLFDAAEYTGLVEPGYKDSNRQIVFREAAAHKPRR